MRRLWTPGEPTLTGSPDRFWDDPERQHAGGPPEGFFLQGIKPVAGGDVTAPGTITDLAFDGGPGNPNTSGDFILTFTQPGNNGFSVPSGLPAFYEVRSRPIFLITTEGQWNAATIVDGPWSVVSAGWIVNTTTGLYECCFNGAGLLSFAIRFKDAAGNISGISNNVQDVFS